MRRRATVALASVLVAMSASLGAGQSSVPPPTVTIGAAAGPSVPVGDLGGRVSSGYTASVSIAAGPAESALSFRFAAVFDEFRWKRHDELRRRMVGGIADVIYVMPTGGPDAAVAQSLYLVGGMGMFGSYDSSSSGSSGTTSTSPGVNVGVGYRIPRFGVETRVEAAFRSVASSPSQQLIPITLGITF